MSIPRRSVLSAVPALAALAGLASMASAARTVVNVRDFGATGNGKTDDSAAIQAATRALQSGNILYFPKGSYRFAEQNPRGPAAIFLTGISNVYIEFDDGAELVMDNLDDDGMGTSHGILLRGPASRVALHNVKVRWVSRPARSLGDGIRILGYPTGIGAAPRGWSGPPAPVSNVLLSNCVIRSSPQAGVMLIGASDIDVADLQAHDTAADGLHFNACRRATVSRHTATNNGDDGLALVTEFSDPPSFNSYEQTFAFPELTEWSNTDFEISDVSVSGGRANGVRFAGANRVLLRRLAVTNKKAGAGVVVDSAAEINSGSAWQYVASRGVRLEDLTVTNCEMGLQLLARPGPDGDDRFTDFDLAVSDVNIRDCSNWAVRAESLTQHPVTGLRLSACTVGSTSTAGGNGGVGLGNTRDLNFDDVSVSHSKPVITFSANNTHRLAVGSLQLSITHPERPPEAPIPAALFENCEGAIDALHVSWPQAPDSWTPVQVQKQGTAHAPPVAIQMLSVQPASVIKPLGAV